MKTKSKLSHPIFILSVLLLIINDWYFKAAFHNELTGKLSDFAGLVAFPFLFSSLFPKFKKAIHLFSVVLFLYWNSQLSQPLIDFSTSFGIPVNRTVDFSDNIALLSIGLSYWLLKRGKTFSLKPIAHFALIFVSCIAFMATTIAQKANHKYTKIDKEYSFDFPKKELISRLKNVKLTNEEKSNRRIKTVDISIQPTDFLCNNKTETIMLMLEINITSNQDTVKQKIKIAEIMIAGDSVSSSMKLLTAYKIAPAFRDKDYRKAAIKQFERYVVKKIKKNR